MTLNKMECDRRTVIVEAHAIQNFPAVMDISTTCSEELVADTDEPPDEKLDLTPRPHSAELASSQARDFDREARILSPRKLSLLTQALHTSDSDSHNTEEDNNSQAHSISLSRGMSSASLWSNTSAGSMAELTSDGGFTSPGTRNSSPSPPLPPASFRGLPAIFNKPTFTNTVKIRTEDDHIGPTQTATTPVLGPNESAVEAGLGRKRCISFACGKKDTPAPLAVSPPPPPPPPKVAEPQPAPAKRPCTIRFACPNKVSTDQPARQLKPQVQQRQPSPAPKLLKAAVDASKSSPRSHRGSDSTVRNPSPNAMRKPSFTPRPRRDSDNSDIGRSEATRFHEFASSEEEIDEWVQESTCHRSRLTIYDTLRVENNLRKLGEEAEEEAIEEEAELEEEEEDDDEDDGDDEDDDDDLEMDEDDIDDDVDDDNDLQDDEYKLYEGDSSDDGFKTDDEEGFAVSDDESDAGSDYAWWAPQRINGSTTITQPDHIRPSARRSFSDSSVGSYGSGPSLPHGVLPSAGLKRRKHKPKPLNIRPRSPELPDSTDFVCGTLDEDRPLEEAYISALEARRIAKHRFTPQDIDPTFPTSDPEMDEEDEEEDEQFAHAEESDQHLMMVGSLDATDGEFRGRLRSNSSRSPDFGVKRMKSPAPARRTPSHRSPPPRRLFDSPPKRLRSPPPTRRLRSPPPTRRPSFAKSPKSANSTHFIGLAGRPQAFVASSLPRTPISALPPHLSEDEEETSKEQPPSRGAIEIKVGLERKRQRRQEKLYQKYCRKEAQREKDKRLRPGIGCKKMREIGLESISRRRQEMPITDNKEAMILSV